MKQLTILPYLGLQDEINLGRGIKIWNFLKYKNKYIPNDADREKAEKLVNMFEKVEWVNAISINNNVFRERKGSTIQEIELLLFIASMAMGNVRSSIYGNDDSSSTAENFSFNVLPFKLLLKPNISFNGNLLTKFTNPFNLPIEKGIILTSPLIVERTSKNTQFDTDLISALNKLRKNNKSVYDQILRSLEMLFLTASNNPLIPNLIHFILTTSAFENLLGSGRENVKNKIDNIFKGSKLFVSKYENIAGKIGIETKNPRRTAHAIWYEHLCRTRNRTVHGSELNPDHYRYHNQRHRYIAHLIYVQCLKYILNNELGINLKGNVIRISKDGKRWFQYVE